jgi:hypothetical protein
MRRSRRIALLASAAVTGIVVAGCGSEDFPNDPRPPAPIELTAKVDDRKVIVSPTEFGGEPVGAGLANITIANLTDEGTELTFAGPDRDWTTNPIVANGVLEYKLNLAPGNYIVTAEDEAVQPMEFEVGAERPSAQNDLLLP